MCQNQNTAEVKWSPQDVRLRMTILVFHHLIQRLGKASQVLKTLTLTYVDAEHHESNASLSAGP